MKKKKVKFYTFGCKVNQYETQAMREQFLQGAVSESANDSADYYVVNTCTVTRHSDKESLKIIKKLSRTWPKAKIIATGCLVEKNRESISEVSPHVRIIPNSHKHRIFEIISKARSSLPSTYKKRYPPLKISNFKNHQRAFVKIQDGCDNYCSYCKVPIVRGSSRSRKFSEVIDEVSTLVKNGYKEIVLSGICLGDYRYREYRLSDLLSAFGDVPGEFRIRLSSIEPQLVSDKLIKALELPWVCAHLHLPLQSADNRVLKYMNRNYRRAQYEALVRKVRKRIKNVSITTDVLVGFPGETYDQFQNTLECIKSIKPLRTHVFPYSVREFTKAAMMHPRLNETVIKERAASLRRVAQKASFEFRKRFLGKKLFVLIEASPQSAAGMRGGYSGNYIQASVSNATVEDVGMIVPVEIKKVDECFTQGIIIR